MSGALSMMARENIGTAYDDYPDWREWWLTARFREAYPNDIPTPGHLQSMAAIVDGLGSPWNISTNWDRCRWHPNGMISFVYASDLASVDSDGLTKVVLAAHKHCVRVTIKPASPRHLRLVFWPRDKMKDSRSEGHPRLNDLASLALAMDQVNRVASKQADRLEDQS